jgi:hypothetical protein
MAVAVGLLLVLFAGLSRHSAAMTLGQPSATSPDTALPGPTAALLPAGPQVPLFLALGVTAVIGFAAGPLSTLLTQAASLLAGSR